MSPRECNDRVAVPMHLDMAPRAVRPGIYHATFTVVRRLYLLWPGKRLEKIVWYLAALTAQRYGLALHEVMTMSNHVHLEFGDRYGNHPEAIAFFEALLARQVNAMLGESGSVFEPYNVVELLDDDSMLDTAGYILANPVKEHLVEKSSQWPGASSWDMDYGHPLVIKRPSVGLWADIAEKERRAQLRKPDSTGRAKYRSKPSTLPDEIEFELVRPPCLPGLSDEQVRSQVRARVVKAEQEARSDREETGRKVVGIGELKKRGRQQMSTEAPMKRRQLFGRRPRHAGAPELVKAATFRDREWSRSYRNRRERFLDGDRNSPWPEHTWQMRMRHGVPCEGAPPLWPLPIGPMPPA